MARKKEPMPPEQPAAAPTPVHAEDQEIIKSMLFAKVEKPKDLCDTKIVNVFEDRYRINLWIKSEEDGIEKKKIGNSYFIRYDGEKIEVKA